MSEQEKVIHISIGAIIKYIALFLIYLFVLGSFLFIAPYWHQFFTPIVHFIADVIGVRIDSWSNLNFYEQQAFRKFGLIVNFVVFWLDGFFLSILFSYFLFKSLWRRIALSVIVATVYACLIAIMIIGMSS